MAYGIHITPLALSNLKAVRAFERRRIVDEIDRQLHHQPGVETRNRKRLDWLVPEFEHQLPVWELRVGDYRVFYDVDGSTSTVYVRTIRRKEHGQRRRTLPMAQATIEQFAKDVDGYLMTAQKERVIVTRNGEPLALVIGMENKDAEDFHYMTSPEFWRMIEETRRMPTVPFEEVKAELFADGTITPETRQLMNPELNK